MRVARRREVGGSFLGDVVKPIRFSRHALEQMRLRGASEAEVITTIRDSQWHPARQGKFQTRKTFSFGQASPINQQVYPFKTIHAIFADELQAVVVITVLVYYGGQEAGE